MCEDAIISCALKIFSSDAVEAILDFNASCEPMDHFSPATIFSCSTGVAFFALGFFSTSGLPALVT